jgi:hypothetical protein
MSVFGTDPKKDADALLNVLVELRRDILSYDLRCTFLSELKERSDRLFSGLQERPEADPQKALVSMLHTASLGMSEDDFTTPKIDAFQQCLVALGAARLPPGEVDRCRTAMLWAGLLGYGYSGGKRATVDGKY